MKKHIRIKPKNNQKITLTPSSPAERLELDKNVIDLTLRMLFENANTNAIDLHKDILQKARIVLPVKETQRIWDVLTSSGWVSPTIGFGKAGKLELTKAGFQMMSQFGGYAQYLASMQNNNQPQTIILPIQIEGDGNQDTEALPPKSG
ncbi:MAG TPA: hypothetical protein PL009_11715 [Flavipsychrobacter sp.]|nr:hypothetical protein [Flavipsychrobacter sp.]